MQSCGRCLLNNVPHWAICAIINASLGRVHCASSLLLILVISWRRGRVWTYVSRCSDSPAPPRLVSGSASCGETPEPRFEPLWLTDAVPPCPLYTGCSFFTVRVLDRNPLCLHLASKPRLWCLGRGAPHIWNSRRDAILLVEDSPPIYLSVSKCCISGAAAVLRVSVHRSSSRVLFTIRRPTLTTSAFELGRDGLLGRDYPSLPGYYMHNLWEAEPNWLPLTASPTSSWSTLGYWSSRIAHVVAPDHFISRHVKGTFQGKQK